METQMSKKNVISLILVSVFTGLILGCENTQKNKPTSENSSQPQSTVNYENIDVERFKELMKNDDVVILDVRTDEEVSNGAIEGSAQIDFYKEDFKEQLSKLDPNKTYLVYCKTGGRSSQSCKILTEELGFSNIKNLQGGYTAWENAANEKSED